jgi:hypothetical protein
MKALLILIVTVGTSQANIEAVDSSLDVRQIEFASIQSCEQAASRLTNAGQSNSNWAKTFAQSSSRIGPLGGPSLFVSPPNVIAECVEVE